MRSEKLRLLCQHVPAKNVPELLNTLRLIGVKSKMLDKLKVEHVAYVDILKQRLATVPHFVEKRVQDMPMVLGVRTLKEELGLTLHEALWFHKYFAKGIIPWFCE